MGPEKLEVTGTVGAVSVSIPRPPSLGDVRGLSD